MQLTASFTQVPESYGDTAAEYAAIREDGAGILDLSSRGRLSINGSEAVQFLNGLITNDMKTLVENTWMPAVFPNVQGRLIASVRVTRLPDIQTDKTVGPSYLIDTEAATHESVLKTLQRFTLAGDFRLTDVTAETVHFSVQGNKANGVVRELLGDEASDLGANGAMKTEWQTGEVIVLNAPQLSSKGFDLVVDAGIGGDLWQALINAGGTPVGLAAQEILRIEAGIPRYGIDMDETNVVTETSLDDSVSYTKGCYIGQEIIARIKYRGHVAKKLTGISLNESRGVSPGDVIKSVDGKEVGRITSSTFSPHLKQSIALGYLKYDYLTPGTEVKISSGEDELTGKVTELPFVRG